MPDIDYTKLVPHEDPIAWLRPHMERSRARLERFQPITVEDRFEGFKRVNFHPHGIYLPEDPKRQADIKKRLTEIGQIIRIVDEKDELEGDRLKAYEDLQQETERFQLAGIPGHWTGQQAVARSTARFRIVAWGRRGGKTAYAAHEALGVALVRPKSWIWLAAPIAKLVGRSFDYVLDGLDRIGIKDQCRIKNQEQSHEAILPNGSKIEGVSLENVMSVAGAAIDFAVVDEAAQILPDSWERGILPPLADKNGGALLISSYEGEGDFFSNKVLELKKEIERAKELGFEIPDQRWEMFESASYDVNFYAFPQGLNTKTLQDLRKEMSVDTFAEQFGAVAGGARERVYPEFREAVHVGHYPFNPNHPVRLSCDPSSGSNPYCILAIQDYRDFIVIIDEIYVKGTKAEELDRLMRRKPWAANVTDMMCDSAWPHEVVRWNEMGWRAYAVHDKPDIPDSIPVVQNMLRNAVMYDQYYRARVNYILKTMGYEPDSDFFLPEEIQKDVYFRAQETLTSTSAEDIEFLKKAARLFINRACVNTILEFKSYVYNKPRNMNRNFDERPRKYQDHAMDAIRYFLFTYFRFNGDDHPLMHSYMENWGPKEMPDDLAEVPKENMQAQASRLWLAHHRGLHDGKNQGVRSYLRAS